jgi:Bacterial extracellular solute-binding protein
VTEAPRSRLRDPRVRLLIGGGCVLAVGLGTGWYLMRDSSVTCGAPNVAIKVAAAPDIAPALKQVAAGFNVESHGVNGRCVRVSIVVADPAAQARAYRAGTPQTVAGWVPDSSMWITIARGSSIGAATVSSSTTSLAISPVVIAMPRQVAAGLKTPVSWRLLTHASDSLVQIPAPARSAQGIATVLATHKIVPNDSDALIKHDAVTDPARLFTSFAGLANMRTPIVVTTEQSVDAYNTTHQPNPVAAVEPAEGTMVMDYPLVPTTRDLMAAEAVDSFRFALQARSAAVILRQDGFRGTGGVLPKLLAFPTAAQVTAAAAVG